MPCYAITTHDEHDNARKSSGRRDAFAARNAAYAHAYEVLQSFGKLDTPTAWRLYHAINAHSTEAMGIGESAAWLISNTGHTVTLSRRS